MMNRVIVKHDYNNKRNNLSKNSLENYLNLLFDDVTKYYFPA